MLLILFIDHYYDIYVYLYIAIVRTVALIWFHAKNYIYVRVSFLVLSYCKILFHFCYKGSPHNWCEKRSAISGWNKKIFFVCAPNSYFSLKELPVTSIKNVRLIPKWKGNQASFFLFSLLTLYVSVVSCKKMLQWNARLFRLERYKMIPR